MFSILHVLISAAVLLLFTVLLASIYYYKKKAAKYELLYLRDSTSLEQIVHSSEEAFWVWNPDRQRIDYVSPLYEKIWGRSADGLFRNPVSWQDAVYEPDAAIVRDITEAVSKGLNPQIRTEIRIVHPDSGVHWLSVRIFPAERSAAERLVVVASRDITEERESLHLFERSFFDNPSPMSITDLSDGRYFEVNSSWLNVMEYSREEVIGHTVYEINVYKNSSDRSAYIDRIKGKADTQGAEFFFISKSGKELVGFLFADIIRIAGRKMLLVTALDITDKRRTEHLLHKNRQQMNDLASNAPGVLFQAFLRLNREWGFYYVSDRVLDVFGIDARPLEDFASRFSEHIHVCDKERFRSSIVSALGRESLWEFEGRFVKPGGETIWFRCNVRSFFGDDGEFLMTGVVLDVTSWKKMENALKTSEARFHSLFSSMREGVALYEMVTDNSGNAVNYRFLSVNPSFLKHFGLSADDVVGRLWTEVYGGEKALYLDDYAAVIRTGIPLQMEVYSDKFRRHYSLSAVSPSHGQFSVVYTDITERKKTADEISRLKDFLSMVIDASTSVIFGLDSDMTVSLINREGEKMLGVAKADTVGRPASDVLGMFIPLIAPLRDDIVSQRQVFRRKQPLGTGREKKYFNVAVNPLVGRTGNGAVVRLDDVTMLPAAMRSSCRLRKWRLSAILREGWRMISTMCSAV